MHAEARHAHFASPLWPLLRTFSWNELRHHGLRHAAAMMAVMLGVALGLSVHLINDSAVAEFQSAVRSVNGQADVSLQPASGTLDESLYPQLARHPDVRAISPVIDVRTQAKGQPLRILAIDPLMARLLTPALVPHVSRDVIGNDRMTLFDPKVIFLNAQAQRALEVVPGSEITVQSGMQVLTLRVAGTVDARGEVLGVMDIAGAQQAFDMLGRISRLEIKLKEGRNPQGLLSSVHLPQGVLSEPAEAASAQASRLSRAYRVNLTVLALIALFTGAYLVFSVLSLSVAQRLRQFALLGVLGLSARERSQLVMLEAGIVGLVGAVGGVALGAAVAALALQWLGGDLGGDYFVGIAPSLRWSWPAAALYGGLGVLSAVWGGWMPARMAQGFVPASVLKGTRSPERLSAAWWPPLLWFAAAAALSQMPPVHGMPLAAYGAVACVMVGGIQCVPAMVQTMLGTLMRVLPTAWLTRQAAVSLALARVRHMRQSATVAMAGVVVSLGLSVALTIMIGSFRSSIDAWLNTLLPADLYLRMSDSTQGGDALHLQGAFLDAMRGLPGVRQAMGVRVTRLAMGRDRAPVALIARPLPASEDDVRHALPLLAAPRQRTPGQGDIGIYVSEAVQELYDARPGAVLTLPVRAGHAGVPAQVLGVWRDYAHQQGAIVMDMADYQRLTGDPRINDVALWLAPGTRIEDIEQSIRHLADAHRLDGSLLKFESPRDIRQATLKVFERSFAVTYWLEAVALGIGLFGISASFSAQVLARRKEFGLLTHLGFTRRDILGMLAGEGLALTAVGALLGLALGVVVSVILVEVINPQSFHWSMDMVLPWPRLCALFMAMVAAGGATAWLAAGKAWGRDVIQAVKEDW